MKKKIILFEFVLNLRERTCSHNSYYNFLSLSVYDPKSLSFPLRSKSALRNSSNIWPKNVRKYFKMTSDCTNVRPDGSPYSMDVNVCFRRKFETIFPAIC